MDVGERDGSPRPCGTVQYQDVRGRDDHRWTDQVAIPAVPYFVRATGRLRNSAAPTADHYVPIPRQTAPDFARTRARALSDRLRPRAAATDRSSPLVRVPLGVDDPR